MNEELKIVFAGDFVLQHPDSFEVSMEIKSIISSADYSVINFEAPISVDNQPSLKSGPSISQSPFSPGIVMDMGFKMVCLSNNHMYDFGDAGVNKTKTAFSGIDIIGCATYDEVYSLKIVSINEKRIGFLSGCHMEFGIFDDVDPVNRNLCSWINSRRLDDAIEKGRKEVDYLFVISHAGIEDIDQPLPEWRKRYKDILDLGADCVIASHPHIIQGFECYKGKFIFYSLGNFFFESHQAPIHWNTGMLLQLNIDRDNVSPHFWFVENKSGHLTIRNDYDDHFKEVCACLNDEKLYLEQIERYVAQLYEMYRGYFCSVFGIPRINNGLKRNLSLLKSALSGEINYPLWLNLIRCESHRWLLQRSITALMK